MSWIHCDPGCNLVKVQYTKSCVSPPPPKLGPQIYILWILPGKLIPADSYVGYITAQPNSENYWSDFCPALPASWLRARSLKNPHILSFVPSFMEQWMEAFILPLKNLHLWITSHLSIYSWCWDDYSFRSFYQVIHSISWFNVASRTGMPIEAA